MFTGIIQTLGELVSVTEYDQFRTHTVRISPEYLTGLSLGASIANNGCCLTVTKVDGDLVSFDLIQSTLGITNLGLLQVGDKINIERAAKIGDEIGGHLMSGHILTFATLVECVVTEHNTTLWLTLPPQYAHFLFEKGYIGLDGISLTIGQVDSNRFCVHLIPETLARTNLGWRKVGDVINIEIDPQTQVLVETVQRLLQKN
jgi:riboflavin synthase